MIRAKKTIVRRIVLLIDQDSSFSRDVIRGVGRYALSENCEFHNGPLDWRAFRACREWEPDGIIAHLTTPRIARNMQAIGKPLVDIACACPDLAVPVVAVDHTAVGSMAAKHLLNLSRSFVQFGYFGSSQAYYSKLQQASFLATLLEAGYTTSTCNIGSLLHRRRLGSWTGADQKAKQWLTNLPKPTAVFACNDVLARDLVRCCTLLGYQVPEDVAIVGVSNDEFECQSASPPISSVAVPGLEIGYEAARLLGRLMAGKKRVKSIFLSPINVVQRRSTDVLLLGDPEVAAAMAFIQQHACEEITVEDVSESATVGRRTLEAKFRSLLKRTVLDEIHRVRIEKAKELLATTDLSMSRVAKVSGFGNAQWFATVFRQKSGSSPTDYRRSVNHRISPDRDYQWQY